MKCATIVISEVCARTWPETHELRFARWRKRALALRHDLNHVLDPGVCVCVCVCVCAEHENTNKHERPVYKLVREQRGMATAPDAELSIFVVSRLNSHDHVGFKWSLQRSCPRRDADRTLVHIEERPNAVSSAVAVVQPCVPQTPPRKRVN